MSGPSELLALGVYMEGAWPEGAWPEGAWPRASLGAGSAGSQGGAGLLLGEKGEGGDDTEIFLFESFLLIDGKSLFSMFMLIDITSK